jgi:hypothetical protein
MNFWKNTYHVHYIMKKSSMPLKRLAALVPVDLPLVKKVLFYTHVA